MTPFESAANKIFNCLPDSSIELNADEVAAIRDRLMRYTIRAERVQEYFYNDGRSRRYSRKKQK